MQLPHTIQAYQHTARTRKGKEDQRNPPLKTRLPVTEQSQSHARTTKRRTYNGEGRMVPAGVRGSKTPQSTTLAKTANIESGWHKPLVESQRLPIAAQQKKNCPCWQRRHPDTPAIGSGISGGSDQSYRAPRVSTDAPSQPGDTEHHPPSERRMLDTAPVTTPHIRGGSHTARGGKYTN